MRHLDWQFRLSELIHKNEPRHFDFPTFNCAFFAADAIIAVTDVDVLDAYRGVFKTETQAKRLLKKLDNVQTTQELFILKLAQPELKPVAFARMGDIVFLDETREELGSVADTRLFGPTPGVCLGALSFFAGEYGLVSLPTLQMSSALWVS